MTENSEQQQNIIRRYLLGTLSDPLEMRRVEERILLDDSFTEHLSMAEDDLIEEYLDGNLSASEREQFLRFFLIVPEAKEKVRLTENLRRYAAQTAVPTIERNLKEKKRSFGFFNWQRLQAGSPVFVLAALVVILCALGFVVWRVGFYQSDASQGLAELRAGYRNERPFESRLTNFDYAPYANVRGNESSTVETLARDRAARKLLDAERDEPGAESSHALGSYYLTEKQFEKAFAQFDAALKLDPNDAQIYNDYGVALLEAAGRQDGARLENLSRAFEYFNKAVELDDSMLESRFNKAITLQRMNLPEQAKKAWLEYLEKDSTSRYADEARRNLQRLETPTASAKTPERVLADFFEALDRNDDETAWQIVSQTRETITGMMVFFQLTQNFLAADDAGQIAAAAKYLAALRAVGRLEKEKAGDVYFAELAEFYAASSHPTRETLRQAQERMKNGYRLTAASEYSEAITQFTEAREMFDRAGNVWESKMSEYWLGFTYVRKGEHGNSAPLFQTLEDYCEKGNYKWLSAQALNWLAEAAFNDNEYSKAINYLEKALVLTKESSDTHNRQKILARLGGYYTYLGERQKALMQIEAIADLTPTYFSSNRQTWRNCLFIAETLHKFKLHSAAIAYGEEAFLLGNEKITEATANHSSYYKLALLYGGAGKFTEALAYARQSLLSIENVKEDDKRLLRNYSLLQTADLYRQKGDCAEALKIYATVIEETDGEGGGLRLALSNYLARKNRLLCRFALGETTLIEEELPLVLDLYEKFRAQIDEEQTRNVFFDNEQNIYDLAVNFERLRNNFRRAFETAEKSKARSLLDLLQTKTVSEKNAPEAETPLDQAARPLSLEEIQGRLPEQVQLVQYAVLPDKLLIWVVTRDRFGTITEEVSSSEISERVEKYLKSITKNRGEIIDENGAQELYKTLVAPVLPHLDAAKEIAFVPDKVLHRLPFAALISPADRRFLLEDYTIFLAPSATMLVLDSEAAARKSANGERLLSVGNPSHNRSDFADLPDAEREAVRLAGYYQKPVKLIATDADKKTILRHLSDQDIFHFAGHYVVNETLPMRSRLLLAQSRENDSAADVEVRELLERDVASIKLAVLSACRTGTENYYAGEGMVGAARSFLAGGVPLVIASQWEVDSEATAELMIKFHSYRREDRLSSAQALRQAQLKMLKDENSKFKSPYFWAGFSPIGGYAAY